MCMVNECKCEERKAYFFYMRGGQQIRNLTGTSNSLSTNKSFAKSCQGPVVKRGGNGTERKHGLTGG